MRVTELHREWLRHLHVSGRVNGPRILLTAWARGEVTPDEMREHLPPVWDAVEWPLMAAEVDVWVPAFRFADFDTPSEPATLYRAQVGEMPTGMSWTPDRDVAEWFHSRNQRFGFPDPTVLERVIEPADVLLTHAARDGAEWVVDPRGFDDII